MSDDLWKQYEEADRLHSEGRISDDEMNELAAHYWAHVREAAVDVRISAAKNRKKKTGRPRAGGPVNELQELAMPRAIKLGRPPAVFSPMDQRTLILAVVLRGDNTKSMAQWARDLAYASLDRQMPSYHEHQKAIERWLQDPTKNRLPEWLQTRVERLFPGRSSKAIAMISTRVS